MVKGIKVEDVLQGMPAGERQEFVERVKAEGGVDIRLTVAQRGRRQKRKWFVKGRVVGVRLPDSVYDRIQVLADSAELTVSEWCKAYLIRAAGLMPDGKVRSHHKQKGVSYG